MRMLRLEIEQPLVPIGNYEGYIVRATWVVNTFLKDSGEMIYIS
jgi:hypothetical protein